MGSASPQPAHQAMDIGQAGEDAPAPTVPGQALKGAPGSPTALNWSLMRAAALASLFPCFLLSTGHYCSLTLLVVDHLFERGGSYPYVGLRFFWVSGDERPSAFISTAMAVVTVSFLLLCLSMVATVSMSAAAGFGRRLTLRESLSMVRGILWREPSVACLYFNILSLGYVLSLVAVAVAAGNSFLNQPGAWLLFLSLLGLFLFVYLGLLGSVGFVPEEDVCGVLDALWSTAVALMDEMKLQGFIIFFLSLVVTHGFLMVGGQFWGGSFYMGGGTIRFSSLLVLISILWMLGTCGLFGYVGVLLQV